MSEPTSVQRQLLSPRTDWVLWASLQGGVVIVTALMIVIHEFRGGLPSRPIAGPWFGTVSAAIGTALVVAGTAVYARLVVRAPGESDRVVRLVRERLLAAGAASDPDTKTLEIAAGLVAELRGATIFSWALLEAGAVLAATTLRIAGSLPPLAAVVVLWWLAMLFAAPTASRRKTFAVARLRVAGLTEEQARTFWNRALALVRTRSA